jgi:hypothetical protein
VGRVSGRVGGDGLHAIDRTHFPAALQSLPHHGSSSVLDVVDASTQAAFAFAVLLVIGVAVASREGQGEIARRLCDESALSVAGEAGPRAKVLGGVSGVHGMRRVGRGGG